MKFVPDAPNKSGHNSEIWTKLFQLSEVDRSKDCVMAANIRRALFDA